MQDLFRNKLIATVTPWLLGFYFVAIFLLFLAELGVPGIQDYFRATNQVLILLVLLILPVVIIGMSRFIHSLTLRVSGQELHVELVELRDDMQQEVTKVEANLGGQISNAEQTLWPLLAGKDQACPARLANAHVIIGSKLDPSHLYFAYLFKLTIEKHIPAAQCEIRFPNGGSMKNFADIQHHWVDMYIDSSGTCCQYFNIDHHGKSDDAILDELNTYGQGLGLKWLPSLGASEDYCLVMSAAVAQEYGITSMQDLQQHADKLVFSADPEFLNRKDCYLGLKGYGVEFRSIKPCRITHRYEALRMREADVFVGYETDPELQGNEVLRLADPDQYFPRYQATPVVSQLALDTIPELASALQDLAGVITTDDLIMAVNKLVKHDVDPAIAQRLAEQALGRTA